MVDLIVCAFHQCLSSQLWVCLVGVVDTYATAVTSEGELSSELIESRPALRSQVVVVDANEPSRFVNSFTLRPSCVVTCISAIPGRSTHSLASLSPPPAVVYKSVFFLPVFFFSPLAFDSCFGGATKRDYEVLRLSNTAWESIPLVDAGSANSDAASAHPAEEATTSTADAIDEDDEDLPISIQTNNTLSSLRHFVAKDAIAGRELLLKVVQKQQESRRLLLHNEEASSATSRRTSAFLPDIPLEGEPSDFYRVERQVFKKVSPANEAAALASAQQTVWLGCQNGEVFVHSCDPAAVRRPLIATRLPAGVTAIRHLSGRVFVGLADGHLVVFRRRIAQQHHQPLHSTPAARTPETSAHVSSSSRNELSIGEELSFAETAATASYGAWDLSEAVVIRCAPTGQFAVKTMAVVPPALTLWLAYKNRILVVDSTSFQRLHTSVFLPFQPFCQFKQI